ncbi:MAG: exonuclease SbcCD subunit D [Actinomycetota bacterium]|nr:exonuclease SbcCD subunit D [Actinomycetota bacterium]
MRLLHVSDWHLGATLGRLSREPDHAAVIDEIVGVAADFSPHLILHTGDLFDGFRPPVEAMRLAMDALRRLGEQAPVVVVAGNHDSRPLFRLFDQILRLNGGGARVRFVADVVGYECGPMTFPGDEGETLRLACIPFLHPNALVNVFATRPERWTGKYADGVRNLQDVLRAQLEAGFDPRRDINLYAAHLHVGGAVLARSERTVHVSESYAVDPESLPPVSYAAFGHIHKPQKLPGLIPGRYAGSPIQIDYGELGEQKSVVTVEARPGRSADVTTVPLSGGRPLVCLEGTLEQLAGVADDHRGPAIMAVTMVTDEPVRGLADKVAELFPKADLYQVHNRVINQRHTAVEPVTEDVAESDFRELFRGFLSEKEGLGPRLSGRLSMLFDRLLDAVESEQEPVLEEEALIGVEEN